MYKTQYLLESFYLRKMPVFCKSCQRFWAPTFVFHDPKVLSSIIGLVFFLYINSSGQVTYLIKAHLSFSLRLDHSFYSRLVGTLVSNNSYRCYQLWILNATFNLNKTSYYEDTDESFDKKKKSTGYIGSQNLC